MTPIQQKSYLAEINLPSTAVGTQIMFGFIPQLEGAEIYGIQSFGRADIHASPNQKTMVPAAGLPSLYVTFVVGEEEKLYRIPVTDLNNNFNQGIIRNFANQKINFTKSYVTINAVTSLTANESVCFNFIYKK
jgi:hypothetical protein